MLHICTTVIIVLLFLLLLVTLMSFFLVFCTILRYVTYCRDLSQLLMELLKGRLRDYCTRPPPRELIDLSI